MSKSEPLEKKLIAGIFNGVTEKIPAIDKRWTEEDKRVFSLYPPLPISDNDSCLTGEDKTWLELATFVQDDLQWLLSLEHHKFWSHMIYNNKPHELLVSFLSNSPPEYMKNFYLVNKEIKALYQEIEHLVFLVFVRLSTSKESSECYIENLGEILYNNYLFTVPVMLDICLIYGTSNPEMVRKMIDRVITLEPRFVNDLQEIVPHFFQALKIIKEKFCAENLLMLEKNSGLKLRDVRDLIFYLHDSVCTIQTFLNLCPKGCVLFCLCEYVSEIASFYGNELPKMYETWEKMSYDSNDPLSVNCSDLIEKTRLDFLRMIKHIFDFIAEEANAKPDKCEAFVDEYLNLMLEILSETNFLCDYNLLYSIEFEIGLVTQNCSSVDTVKVNHILEGLALAESNKKVDKTPTKTWRPSQEGDQAVSGVKLNSLITEVKDILPHLEDMFIDECLQYYKYNTENVIAAILEGSLPDHLKDWSPNKQPVPQLANTHHRYDEYNAHGSGSSRGKPTEEDYIEYKGKHKTQYEDLRDLMQDQKELMELKEKNLQLVLQEDEIYDDEYDDTYDENLDVAIRETEETEKERRPLVTPRVLRREKEVEESEESEEESEKEEVPPRDCFVPNPAELREKREQQRQERLRRDVVGRGRGQGQSREVIHNREFKGAHKSFMGNHNRKMQASRKKNQGMIPS